MIFHAIFIIHRDGSETLAFAEGGEGGRALYEMQRDAESCARRLRRQNIRVRMKRVRVEEVRPA